MTSNFLMDEGFQSRGQRKVILNNFLKNRGLECVVTRGVVVDNERNSVMPTPEMADPREGPKLYNQEVVPEQFRCKVIVDEGLEGQDLDQFNVSLTDKVEAQIKFTTTADIHLEDRCEITYPDGRKIRLRVTERIVHHTYSKIAEKFVGIIS